ncbi:DUF1275 family protein [Lactococcus lactis]
MVIQGDTFTRVRGLPYANIMSTGNIKAFGTNLGQYLVSKNTKDLKIHSSSYLLLYHLLWEPLFLLF